MAHKVMYIRNNDTQNLQSVDYNKWLELTEPTNQNSIKSPQRC